MTKLPEQCILFITERMTKGDCDMSYDIRLKDPVTEETAQVPGHLMIGGTYRADYHPETGTFTPALNTYADLNITYNYSGYYYEIYPEKGIRTIYGMSGYDSIAVLTQMIFSEGLRTYIYDMLDQVS